MLRFSFVGLCLLLLVETVAGLSIQRILSSQRIAPVTIILGNDDGWGTAYIRALYQVLKDEGYQIAISAPANNESGTSSLNAPPEPLTSPSDYDLIPAGAPAMGVDPEDDHITYVNSYPVTGIKYGINTTAPALFGGPPNFVLSGINHGNNLGFGTLGSGTVGAANEAVSQGIPAIAFSGPGFQRPYANMTADDVAYTYSKVAVKLLNTLVAAGAPYLPADVGLNVNFNNGTNCTPDSFVFVMSRIYMSLNPFRHDVQQCGTDRLPTEASVGNGGPCRVSISGFQKNSKMDISADKQKVIRDKLAGILSCV